MRAAKESMTAPWLLLLPFTIWGVHFLAVYVATAICCAKTTHAAAAILAIRWIAVAVTLAGFAALAAVLRFADGRRRDAERPRSSAQGEARFVRSVLLMMAALSALAMVSVAAVVFFFGDCR